MIGEPCPRCGATLVGDGCGVCNWPDEPFVTDAQCLDCRNVFDSDVMHDAGKRCAECYIVKLESREKQRLALIEVELKARGLVRTAYVPPRHTNEDIKVVNQWWFSLVAALAEMPG